ncbi:DHA2 family efflux MFS transporter permease subunit [Levilactobacillus suantsaiihabitans]|uniref:DHA2 family efflux MFS transporter permease subunit n=1 Tax=Levilactobacillus suantsaiihabitans TaxID=2487722 RepID=A0A4Z0J510_9LACO|nr:DHA2 family efflux MFS transporter permease subunit [Levilactobacillus suantsaiihabitans]TGD17470.1 DHA2 family efflux MFS transporter permease subunit [Levilactobacillus suantsaiihabitans]
MSKKQTNVGLVTVAVFVATFMSAVEGTIVSTAMPTIVGDLHGVALMNWVFSIFLLTNALATPIYGKLADTVGRKSVFLVGLFIFVLGSTLSGMSHSMETLIAWRALQGIGAGAIMPVSFTILADIYPVEQRARVMGLNGSAWGIAAVVAPLLGGFIVDQLSWHWIFFINIPIGIITIALIWFFLNETTERKAFTMDWFGSLWLSVGLLAMMLTFQLLGEGQINVLWVIIGFVVAIVAFALFIRQEKRTADPLIPMSLFSNRTFVIQNLIAALLSGFIMGFEVYLPTWTQGLLGLMASQAGFAITPSSLMWIVGSFIAGKLLLNRSPYSIVNLALVLVLIGAVTMAVIPASTPFWCFFVIAAICGTGFGITITTTTVTVQSKVAVDEVGVATSFNTLSRTLGQTIMVSIFGIIMNLEMARGVASHPGTNLAMMNKLINPQTAKELPAHLLPTLHGILYQGLHVIFIGGVLLIIISFLVNFFDRKDTEQVTGHQG